MSIITTSDPIYFNNINLLTIPGLFINSINPHRYQNRKVTNFALASVDGSVTTSSFNAEKDVNIEATIALANRELLDDSMLLLKKILYPENVDLNIYYGGERKLLKKATMQNIAQSDLNGGYCKLDISIVCADAHMYNLTTTQALAVTNDTSGNR